MSNRGSKSLTLHGDSFEGAVQQLSQVFGKFDGRPVGATENFRWSTDISVQGSLRLVSGRYGGEWDLWPIEDTPELLAIVCCRAGAMRTFIGSKPVESTPSSLLFANNLQAGRFTLRGQTNLSDALFIEWPLITRIIAGLFDRPLNGSLDLLPEMEATSMGSCYYLIESMVEGMRPGGVLLNSPVASAQLTESLANLLMLNVPNRFTQFLDRGFQSASPRQVKKAIEYMHEHIAEPLTIQAVSEAVGVSKRSLEASFRAFKDMAPSAYLRSIRLQAAHADLTDQKTPLSIAEVCAKWGFFHLGRFSELYRKAYGVSPSEARKQSYRLEQK